MDDIRALLIEMHQLLKNYQEFQYDEGIEFAIIGTEEETWKFLESNELWGGAGSIADQALISTSGRKPLEMILIKLGTLQKENGRLNERTIFWTDAFIEM